MGELDDVLKALADEREQSLRQIADDLGVDWDEIKAAGEMWAAAQAERDAEAARMFAYVDSQMPRITAELNRDWLRPALDAAGFAPQDVERFEVTYVRDDGFRPGLFAQEGDGTCAVGYGCPPWPKADE